MDSCDDDEKENSDSSSGLTTITTIMLTSGSGASQEDIQKIGAVLEEDSVSGIINHGNNSFAKVNILKLELKRLVEVYADERKLVNKILSLISLCNELSLEFEQKRINDADTHQKNLNEMALKLFTLESNNKDYIMQINNLIKENENIQNTNETLNQYIREAEISQVREVGTLKAKMSLMRIEKEVNHENEIENEVIASKLKSKKKNFPAFFRKKQPKKIDIINSAEYLLEKNEEKLKLELEYMSIEIESLTKSCDDFHKREDLLESELLSKDIEISKKQKRIKELNEKCLQNKNFNSDCQQLIKASQLKINRTSCVIKTVEDELKERRCDVGNMCMKIAQLQFCIDNVDDENKRLLSRLNKTTFEICNEKNKFNLLFDYLIAFSKIAPNTSAFPSNISCNESIQIIEEFFKERIEISKKYMSDLIQHNEVHNKTSFEEPESQTEIIIKRHTFAHDSKLSDTSISDFTKNIFNTKPTPKKFKYDRTPSFINNDFIRNSSVNLHTQEKDRESNEKFLDKNNKLSASNSREEHSYRYKKTFCVDNENNPGEIKISKQEIQRHPKELTKLLKKNYDTPNTRTLNHESKSQSSIAKRKPSRDRHLDKNFMKTSNFKADKSSCSFESMSASKALRNEILPKIANVNDLLYFNGSSSIEEEKRNLFMQHYKEGTTSIKKILVKKADFEKCVQLLRSGSMKAV